MPRASRATIVSLAGSAGFALLVGAVTTAGLVGVNRLAAPPPRPLPAEGSSPDYRAVVETVTEAAIAEDLRRLRGCGSRFTGSPGCEEAAAYVAGVLERLGYTVVEQPFAVTVPVVRHARIRDAAGGCLEGASIQPLLPNGFRTPTTGPGSLTGIVYEGRKGLAREFAGVDLAGNISLLPAGAPFNVVGGMGAGGVRPGRFGRGGAGDPDVLVQVRPGARGDGRAPAGPGRGGGLVRRGGRGVGGGCGDLPGAGGCEDDPRGGPFVARVGGGADGGGALTDVTDEMRRELLYGADDRAARRVVVSARDVVKTYTLGRVSTPALRGVTLDVYAGEYLSIMGPSGSGKTTLFNMIGGLGKPTAGKVFIDEVDVAQLDAYELAWLRCRKVGYVFQTFNLIPVMTCLENVMLPMVFAGLSSDDARDKAVGILSLVGLGDRLKHRPPQVSGGQQQRVAVARALANDPAIILADEPTGNLDVDTGSEIIELLQRLKASRGVTIISATHDMKMLSASDRVVWIRDGVCDRVELRKDLAIEVGEIRS